MNVFKEVIHPPCLSSRTLKDIYKLYLLHLNLSAGCHDNVIRISNISGWTIFVWFNYDEPYSMTPSLYLKTSIRKKSIQRHKLINRVHLFLNKKKYVFLLVPV